MKLTLRAALVGLLLGFSLSWMGFTDFREVHRMLVLADLRLLLTFAGGVTLTALLLLVLARGRRRPPRPIHKGTIVGGLLFGIGWAVTGACPGAALAQLGEGRLPAALTLAGIFAGVLLHRAVHARFLRWDRVGCDVS
jgi:uncharacterized membrane protein YedE/YeeE